MSGLSGLAAQAAQNFAERLAQCAYPGRGLVVGRDPAGGWIQLYWLMGRSPGSRNRVLQAEGAALRTRPRQAEAGVGDPALTLYEAMLELPGRYIVGNGDQVRGVAEALAAGESFEAALAGREREPDAPNYTPRISALLALEAAPALALSLLRANPADPRHTDRITWRPAPPPPGLGLGLTTYRGDGDPLPPFQGDPLWLPCDAAPERLLDRYWEALHAENRVALALKHIPQGGGSGQIEVRNRG